MAGDRRADAGCTEVRNTPRVQQVREQPETLSNPTPCEELSQACSVDFLLSESSYLTTIMVSWAVAKLVRPLELKFS